MVVGELGGWLLQIKQSQMRAGAPGSGPVTQPEGRGLWELGVSGIGVGIKWDSNDQVCVSGG